MYMYSVVRVCTFLFVDSRECRESIYLALAQEYHLEKKVNDKLQNYIPAKSSKEAFLEKNEVPV